MGKEKDKQIKTAPPRESDATRFNRFLGQTGLGSSIPGSAAARRRSPAAIKKGGRK